LRDVTAGDDGRMFVTRNSRTQSSTNNAKIDPVEITCGADWKYRVTWDS
jgi:hypothetical protein